MKKKYFSVSSALKNIIGKDLITDSFVAIFELVKNSFDADSKRVDVIFDGSESTTSKIVIKDNGKGMDLEDIEKKWLFVAYSAKKDGTEDYRESIKSKRIYAGAKGIGRFSCDRLGNHLNIYSRRSDTEKIIKLTVNWNNFEENLKDRFEDIPVSYSWLDECEYDLKTGTVLEISGIRSSWGVEEVRKLKRSLEKLINPSQENVSKGFSIYLEAKHLKSLDAEAKRNGDNHLVINGKIKNFIFEKLDLKTARITSEVDPSGKYVVTELYDKGRFIYRMKERNIYSIDEWSLSNISVNLFFLDQGSKALFTKYMGIRPVQFGSIFVYKNGFRIHPIGEIGRGDVFGLDGRKQQGTSRYFGTRDLIGRIEINGENEVFKEASSRDGGLERNQYLNVLNDFFIDSVLKRLERFAIGVAKFGNINDFDIQELDSSFPKEKALEFISALTKGEQILDIEYNPEIFDIVSDVSQKSVSSILKNLKRIASDSNDGGLDSDIGKIESRLSEMSKSTQESEEEALLEKKKRRVAEKVARVESVKAREAEVIAQEERVKGELITRQSHFLKSMVSTELENVVSLHHHIGIAAGTIENHVRGVSKRIRSGKEVSADSFLDVLQEISFVARQISAATKFATKANFNLEAELVEKDLTSYMEEYILNICSGVVKTEKNSRADVVFNWSNVVDEEFNIQFRPLEISMVLDGLINNSVKAGATDISFSSSISDNVLIVNIKDNGHGVKASIRDRIFEMGFTTTRGSGLGLLHVKSILERMGGGISLNHDVSSGAEFIIEFKGRIQ